MEDREIVELYWARSESATPAAAGKYGAYCRAIARNILGSDEDAEECVNDTLLQAWNSMPPHRPEKLSAYLAKLTRTLSFNRWKYDHAQKRGGGETALVLDELAECLPGGESVERELERRELTELLNAFLETLPERTRDVFLRRYWYAERVTEIAERSGMKAGHVSVLLHRTRERLRAYLTERDVAL